MQYQPHVKRFIGAQEFFNEMRNGEMRFLVPHNEENLPGAQRKVKVLRVKFSVQFFRRVLSNVHSYMCWFIAPLVGTLQKVLIIF